MSSSLCYAFLYITRYEAHGTGAGWGQVWATPDETEDMSIGLAALMMCVDALLYFIIGKIIDRYFGKFSWTYWCYRGGKDVSIMVVVFMMCSNVVLYLILGKIVDSILKRLAE